MKKKETKTKPSTKKETKQKTKKLTDKQIIADLEIKLKEEQSKYIKELADLENERKRFEKSKTDFIRFSNEMLLSQLIDILDTFTLAMSTQKPSPEVKNFLVGFEMIQKQFNTLLETNGVKIIEVKTGDNFDSSKHNSIEEIKTKEFKKGKIAQIVKNGYMHNDRLLRPTMVKVAK